MLDTPSFASSREMTSSNEQEDDWVYIGLNLIESSNVKRKSEDKDNLGSPGKLLKLKKPENKADDFLDLSLSLGLNQSNNHSNNINGDGAWDNSDTSSLIPQLGPDGSLECLARCSRSDYSSIAQLNSSFRSLTQSKELYNLRRKLGIVEHWIYVSCSLREWMAFDSINCGLKQLPLIPIEDYCFMHSDKESLAVGTDVLVFGRGITSHLIYKYSLLTNSWSTGMMMNKPRCLFGSATLGDIAILAGGCRMGQIVSCAELYNSETETWEILPNMSRPRKKSSAVFMDRKFYVIGGLGDPDSTPLTCGEVFDLETRTWTVIPNMVPPRDPDPGESIAQEAPPLLTVVNNDLYAADYAMMKVMKYNKSSNSWDSIGNLPERLVTVSGWGLAFRGCGNKLIVIGQARSSYRCCVEMYAWDPSQSPQEWKVIGHLPNGFVYNCAIMGC